MGACTVHVRKSEDNLQELVLLLHGCGDPMQASAVTLGAISLIHKTAALGPVFPNLRLLPSDTPGGASLLWDSALTSISKVPYDVGRWLKQSILAEVSLEMPLK